MLENVPTILSAQEILDKAFLKANKLEVPDPDKYHRIRKTEEVQMKHIADTCIEMLGKYVDKFPTLERMSSYEQELLDIVVGLDGLKQALGQLSWTEQKIKEVYQQCARSMREMRNAVGIQAQKRRFSGRCSSLMNDCDKSLTFLRDARDRVRMLPTIHPEYPTVVIAGFPNVGKSSLLAAWTRADPEIAAYAFTTKAANVGHFPVKGAHGKDTFVQVVDTPGLLDRPASRRNAVEKQAVAALRHAADAVLFLIDMSETSGYTIAEQEHLLAQTEREMLGIPLVVAETKADLLKSTTDRLKISPLTGEGLKELQAAIKGVLPLEEPELERDPLELWKSKRDPMFGG
ncbi:MAG: nucleolar GTP-binding protein [Thermoplasmata archaeon]|jgi:nucleolar GTP-binding protein|nr:nucleolar GTP-binding protein [Thermoplasmata archaeon]